eukprot:8239694-Prorocentrum_lima.AAC.1
MEAHGSCTHGMQGMHSVMWGRIVAERRSAAVRSVAIAGKRSWHHYSTCRDEERSNMHSTAR